MIFCFGENTLFPESEFVHTKDGKLFQPPIHHVQPEHWATTGLFVNPAALPGVASYEGASGIVELKITNTSDRGTPAVTPGTLGEDEEE